MEAASASAGRTAAWLAQARHAYVSPKLSLLNGFGAGLRRHKMFLVRFFKNLPTPEGTPSISVELQVVVTC